MGVAFQGFVLVPVLKGCLLLLFKRLGLKKRNCTYHQAHELQLTQKKNNLFMLMYN
jgi:hypothetical protein